MESPENKTEDGKFTMEFLAECFIVHLEERGIVNDEVKKELADSPTKRLEFETYLLQNLKGPSWRDALETEFYKGVDLEDLVKAIVKQLSMEGLDAGENTPTN